MKPGLRSPRFTQLVFAAGLTVWIANGLIQLLSGYPLGHDESQYALGARDMLAGVEQRWFYASAGMNALAVPGVLAGGSEYALRVIPFVFGIGFVLATWQLARRTFGDATAAWVVAVLAGSRSYIRYNVELLSDMPAAACLIAATVILASELGREHGPRWRLVFAAPLLSAAFYIRYGSCIPISILVVLAGALGWRTIARRPAPVIVAGLVFAALFVPHAVMSSRLTGSVFGVLLDMKSVPAHHVARYWMFDALVIYVTSNPFTYYGLLLPPIMLAGLAGLRRDRRIALFWLTAVADIVAFGAFTEPQVRYIFFGTVLLVILGTDVIRRVIVPRAPRS
jgi:4-amino-4-deoxy-L-arabinose transferase-like glycosyltransferase